MGIICWEGGAPQPHQQPKSGVQCPQPGPVSPSPSLWWSQLVGGGLDCAWQPRCGPPTPATASLLGTRRGHDAGRPARAMGDPRGPTGSGVGGWVFGGCFVLTAYLQLRIKTPRFALKRSFFWGGGGHQDTTHTHFPPPPNPPRTKPPKNPHKSPGLQEGPTGQLPAPPPPQCRQGAGRVPWVGVGGCSAVCPPPLQHLSLLLCPSTAVLVFPPCTSA